MLLWLIIQHHESHLRPRLPKLDTGTIAQPYITSTDGIARADRTRLVNGKDRQVTVRRVEDPAKVKERDKKVGSRVSSPFPPMTINIFINLLDAEIICPVLGTRSALLRVLS